jgi:hypothetical protein
VAVAPDHPVRGFHHEAVAAIDRRDDHLVRCQAASIRLLGGGAG